MKYYFGNYLLVNNLNGTYHQVIVIPRDVSIKDVGVKVRVVGMEINRRLPDPHESGVL